MTAMASELDTVAISIMDTSEPTHQMALDCKRASVAFNANDPENTQPGWIFSFNNLIYSLPIDSAAQDTRYLYASSVRLVGGVWVRNSKIPIRIFVRANAG